MCVGGGGGGGGGGLSLSLSLSLPLPPSPSLSLPLPPSLALSLPLPLSLPTDTCPRVQDGDTPLHEAARNGKAEAAAALLQAGADINAKDNVSREGGVGE